MLRARVGQDFDIATGTAVRRGRITSVSDDRVEFELGEEVPAASLSEITLILAIFKFDRMEWAIEKCTELGVSRIVPVIARRTDSHLAAASAKRVERWQRIARQASEQSRRAAPPGDCRSHQGFGSLEFAGSLTHRAGRIGRANFAARRCDTADRKRRNPLAVGPEGGWTEDELQSFQQAGWISASLGNTILRAETAAMAATAIVASAL